MNTFFSIIMPAYNASKSINRAIFSIQNQSYKNWELIIVDDGSSDGTYDLVSEKAKNDSRIMVFKQENKGPGSARNKAISYSTGNFIAFLDSDDYWNKDFLMLINNEIINHNSDLIFYDLICENQNRQVISVHKLSRFANQPKENLIRAQMTGILEWGMVKVIKSKLIKENAIVFSGNSVGEEAIFSFDVLRKARKIRFVNRPIYHYIQSNEGQHKKGGDDPWGETVALLKNHLIEKGLLKKYKKSINSFALRALCISCYRCSQLSYFESKNKIKDKIKDYSKHYDFNCIDYYSLDYMAKLMLILIKLKFFFPIIIASKIRK